MPRPRLTRVAISLLPLLLPSLAGALDENSRVDISHAKLLNPQTNYQLRSELEYPVQPTTYVGFVPGRVSATNYWGIGTGNFVPGSLNSADYGYWGWDNDAIHDNITEVHGDSLFGWWPYRHVYTETGGRTLADTDRPWWALDCGNNANYVINQGTFDASIPNPAPRNRTFGVVGVWHRDPGNTGVGAGNGVGWTPITGAYSLWCGLRRAGDPAFGLDPTLMDPITKNPFDGSVLQYNGVSPGPAPGPARNWPGYASQWDQMAYRDIDVTGAATITLQFKYITHMSTMFATAPDIRTGWFEKDPLEVTTGGFAVGNFVSASAGPPPVDALIAYIGAPVDDAAFLASDSGIRPVYDKLRRWFSEVIRLDRPYTEVMRVTGIHALTTFTSLPVAVSPTWSNKARVVIRVKTNRGYDDESVTPNGCPFSSGGVGAAVIDDVEISLDGAPFASIGIFENASDIDNDPGTDPLDAWKTTGKPPGILSHVHDSFDLFYDDLCGPIGGPLRICQLSGNVISSGDHDNSEAAGGPTPGTVDREPMEGIISPTINLMSGGGVNAMGITAAIATATDDYYIVYDLYTGFFFDMAGTGNAWRFGWQCYPDRQQNGYLAWGNWRFPNFVLFDPDAHCFQDRQPGFAHGLLSWDAASAEGGTDYPDSVRFYLGKVQECFRFGVTAGCSPTDGCYWDNVSLAFVDGVPTRVAGDPWQWINDTFTVNGLDREGVLPGSAEFDTTSALTKTGLNIAQTTGYLPRYDVPGDTMVVVAEGADLRVDLIFRINPGPGNYIAPGNPSTSLRRVPTSFTAVNIGAPAGTNFWEEYLADNGAKGTPGGHPIDGTVNGGKRWSSLIWNSARCDTAETNLWPICARDIGGPKLGHWMSAYHESDPKFATLGIAKQRCYLSTAVAAVTQANTVCDVTLTDGWETVAGYVAENGLTFGQTYEYTKILPDGQFTPGTHVEYYFRREDSPLGDGPFATPDPSTVFPQWGEGPSTDAHRWQEFSVLPDSWKKAAYGGLGPACMLYIDLDDRRGDERVWVSVADSIGMTQAFKFGAHNGWHTAGKADIDINSPLNFVELNQQPGTTWDMFGSKASESLASRAGTIGSNLSNKIPSAVDGKWSFQGPSLEMLEAFYSVLVVLTGDLNTHILGPFADQSGDDAKMLEDFLLGGIAGDENHRGLWVQGNGFVESENSRPLLSTFMEVSLSAPGYMQLTGNTNACVDLVTQAPITTNGDIYGVVNSCYFTNDVLLNGPGSIPATLYSPVGFAAPPVMAGVFHEIDVVSKEYWQSLVDGWDIQHLRSRFCDKNYGRLAYFYNVLINIFAKICAISGNPSITTDVPNNADGRDFTDFVTLSNNPMRSGATRVDFGLARSGRVEVRVYDVGGRLVRTLADRRFAAGSHTLAWDGVDDGGRALQRGVYFTRVRYSDRGFETAKKLIVLR